MSTELHQRLADLAADAPAGTPRSEAGLWRAGKRRQRRRRVAGAVAALSVMAGGVGGVAGLLPGEKGDPARVVSERSAAALPDHLYVPSRWTPSNEEDPVGPFAAISSASSGWSGRTEYFGVSATTGEYRFIDLPGVVVDGSLGDQVALSPSGRYVAYWAAVDSEANASTGQAAASPGVYDTMTGEDVGWTLVDRRDAPYGLAPWDLRWIDDDRLYLQAGEIQGAPGTDGASGSHTTGAGWVVDVDSGRPPTPLVVPGLDKSADVQGSDGHGHLLLDAPGKGAGRLLLDPARPHEAHEVQVRFPDVNGTSSAYRVSTEGRVAVAASGRDGEVLAVTEPHGTARTYEDVPAWDVYGFADPRHVVAAVSDPARNDSASLQSRIVSVDLATGTKTTLISLPSEHLNPPQLASDLLGLPTVTRPAPDDVPGPDDLPWSPMTTSLLLLGGVGVIAYLARRTWRGRRVRG